MLRSALEIPGRFVAAFTAVVLDPAVALQDRDIKEPGYDGRRPAIGGNRSATARRTLNFAAATWTPSYQEAEALPVSRSPRPVNVMMPAMKQP